MKNIELLMVGKFKDVMNYLRTMVELEYCADQAEFRNEWEQNLKTIGAM